MHQRSNATRIATLADSESSFKLRPAIRDIAKPITHAHRIGRSCTLLRLVGSLAHDHVIESTI